MGRLAMQALTQLAPSHMYIYAWNKTRRWHQWCNPNMGIRGVSSRGLEHPPKVWHNSQLSSYVTTIVIDKQQLVAKTSNKLTRLALNGNFLFLLGLKQPSSCVFVIKLSPGMR